MPTRKPKPEKRIPNGTAVSWKSYPYDYMPTHRGVVVGFDSTKKCYEVEVTKTPTGRMRREPVTMRPPAKRLEAQNHTKLRLVK